MKRQMMGWDGIGLGEVEWSPVGWLAGRVGKLREGASFNYF